MALARRSSSRDQGLIWPGFVDGLATLLMVIIFVLMVFFPYTDQSGTAIIRARRNANRIAA
jgi:cbb3-type cytochrome oxidase subunit 3